MNEIEKAMLETYIENATLVVISMDINKEFECTITAFDDQVLSVKEYDGRISMIYRQYIRKIEASKWSNNK